MLRSKLKELEEQLAEKEEENKSLTESLKGKAICTRCFMQKHCITSTLNLV